MRKSGYFLLSIFLSYSALAQDKKAWTLEECIQYALENNIDVRQQGQNVEMADYNRDANSANFFPNLTFSSGYNWNFGYNIDPVTNLPSSANRQTGSFSLSSQWVLFDGLANVNQLRQGRIDYLAATYQLESIKNDITVNISSTYLQILMNKEIAAVALEQKNTSALMLESSKAQYDAGAIAYGDFLQAESQLASDEQRLIQAQNNVTLSILSLAQLLQLEDPTSFDVVSPELDLPAGTVLARSPSDIYTSAREIQPVVKASELNVQSAEYSLNQSQSSYWPTISLQAAISTNYSNRIFAYEGVSDQTIPIGFWNNSGTNVPVYTTTSVPYGQYNKNFGTQFSDNLNEYVGVNLVWPIFSRFQIRNSVRQQEFAVTRAELELDRVENQLRQTIQQAHADAQASLKSYSASTKAAEAAQESLEYARIRREEGAISQYEYESARNNYLAAKSQQLQSKYDYIFKVRVLEFYLTNQL